MQAIQTRILPCTNTKPARIKAWAWAGKLTISVHKIPYEHTDNLHLYAAAVLKEKLQWTGPHYGRLESGTLPNGDFCHVMVKG